jgi:hypothetical protein
MDAHKGEREREHCTYMCGYMWEQPFGERELSTTKRPGLWCDFPGSSLSLLFTSTCPTFLSPTESHISIFPLVRDTYFRLESVSIAFFLYAMYSCLEIQPVIPTNLSVRPPVRV